MAVRILVVDDDEDICGTLKFVLTREGYEAVTLSDPLAVIDELKSRDYHLVVLDMVMPAMNGAELLERIREVDSDIAVIVSTGFPNVETAVLSLKHGVADYLKKPFAMDAFLATVRRALIGKGVALDPETELQHVIGRTIREVRSTQDLTLKQLARRTGLSVSLLSQIERAESSASIGSLQRIATALGLKMAALFGDR